MEKKPGTAKFTCAFIYNNQTYGVWFDYAHGKIFVSNDYIKNTPFMFSTTLTDHRENTLFIKSARKYACWRQFIEQYQLR